MIGLPYEEETDIINTVNLINKLNIMGVKIHSTYVIKGTELEQLYNLGTYKPLELSSYVDQVCNIVSRLNPNIVICRITADAPKNILVAPEWNSHKKIVLNAINRALDDNNITQGMNHKK